MQQAFPSIPQEVKDRLQAKGFVPYYVPEVPEYANPHKWSYWIPNAIIAGIALVARQRATANYSVRIVWTSVILSQPLFAISAKLKLDSLREFGSHRKTLDERLEHYPLTRRAWERALEENNKYQESLREQINKLKGQI